MEGQAMVAEQASCVCAEASLQEGEPVTLVIDDERFFGWVASASHAQRLSCVTVAFKRGYTRVQERIPVENIQLLRDYLVEHPELRTAKEKVA
jgi:hypothetical protein